MINRTNKYNITNSGYARNYIPSNCKCETNISHANNCEGKRLKTELQKIDFALYETILYLDIYPNCQKALSYYKKLVAEREDILLKLTKDKQPINNMSVYADTWTWTDSPWPWELDANV